MGSSPELKNHKSIVAKFAILLAVFSFLFVADLWFLLRKGAGVAAYDRLQNHLASLNAEVVKFEYILDINVVAKSIEKERVGELLTAIERLDSLVNFLKDPYFDVIFSGNSEAAGLRDEIEKQWKDILIAVAALDNVKSAETIFLVHNSADMAALFLTESSEKLKGYAVEQKNIAAIKKRDSVVAAIALSMFIAVGAGWFFIVTALMPVKRFFASLNKTLASGFKENLPENLPGELGLAASGINNAMRNLASEAEENRSRASDAASDAARYEVCFDAVNRMTLTVGATISQYDVFKAVIAEASLIAGADCVAVFLKEGNTFRLRFSNGYSKTFFYKGEELPVSERSFDACAKGEPMVFSFLKGYPEGRFRGVLESEGVETLVMVPIMRDGEARGFLDVAFKKPKVLMSADVLFLKAIAGNMSVAVSYSEIFFKEWDARAFFERIIHQMPFGAAVFDRSGVCVLANGTFKKQMGGGVTSDFVGNYRIFDDETLERQDLMKFINKCYEGQSAEFTAEYKGRGGATLRRLKIRSFPIFESGGNVSAVALFYEDAFDGKVRQVT